MIWSKRRRSQMFLLNFPLSLPNRGNRLLRKNGSQTFQTDMRRGRNIEEQDFQSCIPASILTTPTRQRMRPSDARLLSSASTEPMPPRYRRRLANWEEKINQVRAYGGINLETDGQWVRKKCRVV